MFDPRYDDLMGWVKSTGSGDLWAIRANSANGQGTFTMLGDMIPGQDCDSAGVFFVDVNADGLSDLVCIRTNGDAHYSINNGDGNRAAGKVPTFSYKGLWKANEGEGQARILVGDIDGDGRADYGKVAAGGAFHFWRNGGTGDNPAYWQYLGVRYTNSRSDLSGYRLEDINGDVSKADIKLFPFLTIGAVRLTKISEPRRHIIHELRRSRLD